MDGEACMKKMVLFVGALVLVSAAQSQTLYRCGNTFSQTPCGKDAQTLNVGPKPDAAPSNVSRLVEEAKKRPPPTPDVVAFNIQSCERKIRSSMKDPEAARISQGSRMGPSVGYASERIFPEVSYSFKVNGKNSYGAYTGEKLYTCSFDLAEKDILYIKEIGPYPG